MISCDLLVTGRFIYCYLLCNNIFTTAKTYLLSSSEYCQWNENQNTIHGLTHDINSMPKLLYTWYFEKFTASVTSSGHSALRQKQDMYNYNSILNYYYRINLQTLQIMLSSVNDPIIL